MIFPRLRRKSLTGTNQAIFSSRRALLIQWVINVLFFRFVGIPEWPGWRSLEEWSGHWLVLSWLAQRMWITLAEVAYFFRA